jgi:biotin carboxylase
VVGNTITDKRILLVFSPGGAPLEYALPRIARRAEVHLLALWQPPAHTAALWQPHCTAVIPAWDSPVFGEELSDLIVRQARRIGADAVFTLAEYAMLAVAQAADRLGLRGAGPNAARTRDKRLMRAAWAQAGVPSPRFRPVSTEEELRAAYHELAPPLLLKTAWGAGSVGHVVVDSPDSVASAWSVVGAAVARAKAMGYRELRHESVARDLLVEELIHGSSRTWWPEGSGYGDYLSVEGIVADGEYHPLCITARLPTIPPFTEISNLAPCALPEELQRKIESAARRAVGALGLLTCGTHTEIKLMDGEGLCLIESAGRLGGVMVPAEVEHVFGYDPVGMVVDCLLGRPVAFPGRMLTEADAKGAAGSISMIATDAAGNPWSQSLAWDDSIVDWQSILSPGSRIEAVPGLCIPSGTVVPGYNPTSGALAWGGTFFLSATDASTLVRDSYAVLNGLEGALSAGWRARRATAAGAPAAAIT